MMYPETMILSPGMFMEVDVIFRPVNFEPYDDSIYFKMMEGEGSGGFHFPVKAFIDKLVVEAPEDWTSTTAPSTRPPRKSSSCSMWVRSRLHSGGRHLFHTSSSPCLEPSP